MSCDFPVFLPELFADISLDIRRGLGIRRFVGRQAQLYVEGQPLFYPVPIELAPVLLEWGLNWVVSIRE
ncbi:MAG: hypothetical protein QM736_06715 [Vicinamibacterales bacterium]